MSKITVVGSINIDIVVSVDEIPQIGETVLGRNMKHFPGGKGANQAYAAAKLGAEVSMIGAVGKDENGKLLLDNLRIGGVDNTSIEILNGIHTGCAIVIIDNAGNNQIAVIPGANMFVSPDLVSKNSELIEKSDFIIMQQEIPIETIIYTSKLAKEKNKTVILNPAPAHDSLNEELLQYTDILTPNKIELEKLTGCKVDTIENVISAAKLIVDKGIKNVIVTLGENGAVLVTKDGFIHKKSYNVGEKVDTTAAGDCFNAALAVALQKNMDIDKAIEFANLAAAISITREGAQYSMPTLEEVLDYKHLLG